MDGILGERGLIENAVFHVPIKMLKPFGGFAEMLYLCRRYYEEPIYRAFKFNNSNTFRFMKQKLCEKSKFSCKKLASIELFIYFCR